MTFIERFFKGNSGSFFLFGPRGSGKSTWIRENYGNAIRIDLLDPETYRLYAARPERLKELVSASPNNQCVVLDEVQKAPDLLSVVHNIMDDHSGHRFIMSGSSARKLKRAGVDLLAGRASQLSMHPFIASEIGKNFDIDKALRVGLVPVIYGAPDPQKALSAYIGLYLEQEVKAEALVRDVGSFSRFLEAISFSHASVINIANVARECQVGRNTVQGYIEVLEDLLLSFRVSCFTKRAKRHLVEHPKFYYFDTGVFRSIRPMGPMDIPEEIAGAALEGLVAQHLRAWLAYGHENTKLYFWRTKSGVEIDFVLYGPDAFLAIEVKNSKNVYRSDVRHLTSFKQDYPEAETCLLYRGKERLMIDKVLCIPCQDFLTSLHPEKSISIQ